MPPCPALSRLCRLLRRLVAAGLLAPTIVLAAVQVAWFEDPGGGLRIEQVADASLAGRFAAAEPEFVSFGLSTSAYWLRITLPAGEAPLLLEVATPYLDKLDFHRPRPAGGYELVATGDHRPFATREIPYHHPVFRLAAATHRDSVHYLRVENAGALQIPMRFRTADAFRQSAIDEHFAFGMFYGLALGMALYNLFLYFGIRDRAYLWYVIYVSLFTAFVLARNGFAFQWLWPDSPWLGNNSHYLLIAAAIAAATQFTREFLDTPTRTPRLDLALRLAAVFGLAVAGAALAGWQRAAVLLVQVHSLGAIGIGVTAAVVALRAGYAPARYYLIAFAAIMVTALFSVARNLGLFPANFLSTYGVQVGSALEIIFLALGLGDRINLLKREKEAAQAEALRSQQTAFAVLQNHEQELEHRVRQRTEELAEANEMLRQREQALEHMAHHDVLTGLANRALLEDRLQQALARARRNRQSIALLLIDLDKFKEINDTHGHEHGDAMLVAVAGRLRATVRDCDTVARLGGDEFVLLLGEVHDAGDCDIVAAKLLSAIVEPVHFRDVELRCSVSIGAAIFPANGHDSATLFRQADEAMYAAKRAGRAAYRRAPAESPESAVSLEGQVTESTGLNSQS
jgi:diguanylate cyclase (GGDEF)-like protein